MSDPRSSCDPRSLWRSQPGETVAVDVREFVNRRTSELSAVTRLEVTISITAALFFAGVMAWRFDFRQNASLGLGVALIVIWAVAVVIRFRRQINHPSGNPLAAPCLEYYRQELQQRRDHLRNAWLWHGPLVLSCLVAAGTVASSSSHWYGRIGSVSPLLIVLGLWTALTWSRRLRHASEVQCEIDELDVLAAGGGGD